MKLNTKYLDRFIEKRELALMEDEVSDAHQKLLKGTGAGSDFHGWLHLPSQTKPSELSSIEDIARNVKKSSDVLIVIGIGGSYLGSRAALEFLEPTYQSKRPRIYFTGNSIDPFQLNSLLELVHDRDVTVNVISKSGTTTEPAIAFRVIMDIMAKKYSPLQLKNRVICTTTKGEGALWDIAKKNGYQCLFIPKNVGGRFSVLTPVGLLPMACGGIDIKEVIKGAASMEKSLSKADISSNLANKYAAIRNLLYRNGKKIEILSTFNTRLFYVLEWWKQLFAESEGKEGKGIFAATSVYSTDLHAIGQLIQEGERNIFETFVSVDKKDNDIKIPSAKIDTDKLNYLAGKGVEFVNRMAYEGTALAHVEGGVPNMTLSIDDNSAFCLGQIYYFFQRAVGISGYMLRVNPFDQPGVEAYKKNMFKLLGKPK